MDSLLDFEGIFKLHDELHIPRSASDNFTKSLDISPDGSQVLCSEESNIATLWDLNESELESYKFYENSDVTAKSSSIPSFTKSADICVGESIYDLKWYPFMNKADPSTCCFITTSRDHPIHLWDVATGQIRCSYRCYNKMDEIEAVNSLCFNIMGDKIYAGSNRMIRCFDVANPGRVCVEQPTCKTRRSPDGQRGIISCLAFNPDCSGAYAAGSYANNVSIYVENMVGSALELSGIEFGATHLKWSPCGNNLWVGGRAHDDIICWDLRQTRAELGRVKRNLSSNQRLVFDLDPWGCYLATGSQDGSLLVYDAKTFTLKSSRALGSTCVHTARFHPFSSLLFTSTGQRTFTVDMECSDDEEESSSNNNSNHEDTAGAVLNDAIATATATGSEEAKTAEEAGMTRNSSSTGSRNDSDSNNNMEIATTSGHPDPVHFPTGTVADTSISTSTESGLQVWSIGRFPASIPTVLTDTSAATTSLDEDAQPTGTAVAATTDSTAVIVDEKIKNKDKDDDEEEEIKQESAMSVERQGR